MVIMGLNKKEREVIEGNIFDAHFAASKYIESGKDIHRKLLEISVKEAVDTLQLLSSAVKEDEMVGNYKIHLLVPLQLLELINKREGNESE